MTLGMRGVGASMRLPPVAAMIDRAADQWVQVPSREGRSVADQDFGLVPDLIAAADLLGAPPAIPTLPSADDCILGGLALEELDEILSQRSQVSFDTPWRRRTFARCWIGACCSDGFSAAFIFACCVLFGRSTSNLGCGTGTSCFIISINVERDVAYGGLDDFPGDASFSCVC
ncbi:hypothetical protein PHMEG_0009845 [Phytophthora megakarya]|uniref:Uncharacterized protein n=1 Tax=Phytophthora megakarya TaxID=4795 RepID=A0A225WFH6_9STRA|nr:hypothetical protein PHMEG_0009845 [Phytophthora megakarya]